MLRSLAVLALIASPAHAERAEPLPTALEGVDVTERLGATVPLDTAFTDASGARVRLGDFVQPGVPVILTFNYSSCPMLCSVQLGGLVDALRVMRWQLGRQFRIVTIGLDPAETPELAAKTRARYLDRLPAGTDPDGWVFLTAAGDEAATRAVADTVGFGYRYHEPRREYLHPAALILLSPEGRVSSYQYGVAYDPDELAQAIAVAGTGGTRESTYRFLLSCFHYESPGGAARTARRLMRWGGLGFAASLAFALAIVAYRRS